MSPILRPMQYNPAPSRRYNRLYKKLKSKNLDFIVANDVTMEGAGFATETNVVTLISRNGEVESLPKMLKEEVAAAIIDRVVALTQA